MPIFARRPRASFARFVAVTLALVALLGILGPVRAARAELVDIPYTVVSGDTARRVARRHGLTYAELRALNGERNLDRLRVGEHLVVGRGHLHTHRIRSRESLADIALRYRVEPSAILRWNRGVDPAHLRAGAELHIYAEREEPPSESIGRPDHGSLVNGIPIPPHSAYVVRQRARAFMTIDATEQLMAAFDALHDHDPDAPRLEIRDASREHGGRLDQHRSHQSGRDVDIAYFYRRCREVCGLHRLGPDQLDADRQWALIEPWLRAHAVEYVFIDHALQEPLYEAARRAGATRAELSAWFQWPRPPEQRYGVIRHVPRHADHMHVRFVCAEHDQACLHPGATDDEHAED